ncbi:MULTISPECIES: G5 and 3D domain-containing protein [Clostridium]|uniref:DUF348 domain-containing protein n=1 Tax=Clostridium cibarium TaxID=2762247 RepID=A0ABR8PRX5_9CLOT|nr:MULTISPECIES: G5 and 3D domain-containing protein [Clostridium]MBD7910926.1 DUF348 domain-containing protein [Clostridium cibarium]
MVEKFREYLKRSFSNGPKAKIMLGLIICIACIVTILVSMRKTVNISIDGKDETIITYKGTVKDVLQERGYEIVEKDKVQPSLESNITNDETISIKKAVPVKVVIAGEERNILTAENTIEDMLLAEADNLAEDGIYYKDTDIVSPSKDTEIAPDMDIQVVNVKEEEVQDMEDIPFDTEQTIDYNKINTYREVTKAGETGKKAVTYKVVKHNDEVIAKLRVSETPVKDPQTEHVTVGGAIQKTSRSGETYLSKKTLYMEATAYSGGGRTATGRTVTYNPDGISTIAVDPRVIPLGSLVEVSGYGLAIASDTGGVIKGDIIDVYFDSNGECTSWGRKYNVEVNIKAYPGEW